MAKNQDKTTNTTKKSRSNNNPCQCLTHVGGTTYTVGCGGTCGNRFAQGHDARTKSVLIRAFRDGYIKITVDGKATTPVAVAESYGYGRFLTPGPVRAARKPRATKAAKVKSGLQVGDAVEFKVGRWVKRGLVRALSGSLVTVEYQDAKGNSKQFESVIGKVVVL